MVDLDRLPSPDNPDEALAAVVELRQIAERLEFIAVERAIAQGWTWAQVADALGVTRQAAHKRHAKRVADILEDRGAGPTT